METQGKALWDTSKLSLDSGEGSGFGTTIRWKGGQERLELGEHTAGKVSHLGKAQDWQEK